MDTVAEVLWCSVSPAESPRTRDETETEIGSLGANTHQYVTCLWSVQVVSNNAAKERDNLRMLRPRREEEDDGVGMSCGMGARRYRYMLCGIKGSWLEDSVAFERQTG
ncbi:hypothetical protein CNMCM8927_002758 [Aspergillus lentulus]|uniref:Uncharacterized protein n=1 Tax=Aspergillus lentulus TaxID=293939 RepID=A0AAN5YGP5_ASPLE|nr:hypothetical protein CNMCM8927_002758 [Aspergillus lentulus]